MVLQNYQNFTEMTSCMIYIVAFGVGLKCPRKIHLNTQCPPPRFSDLFLRLFTKVPKMDDMIAVAVKDNDPRFRGYLPFIPNSSSVRMSTLVVLDGAVTQCMCHNFVHSCKYRVSH